MMFRLQLAWSLLKRPVSRINWACSLGAHLALAQGTCVHNQLGIVTARFFVILVLIIVCIFIYACM